MCFGDPYNEFGPIAYYANPGRQTFVGFGADKHPYISTAQLTPSPYLTESLCITKLGGQNRLIAALDDSQPPKGTLAPTIGGQPNPVYTNLTNLFQIVTTEINGYLSSIYPIPLMQTGTVCILQVTGLSTDGNNSITSLAVVEPGNYLTAPATNQFPVYMKPIDPLSKQRLWDTINDTIPFCEAGTGANVTVAYTPVNVSDESGQVIPVQQVLAVPTIVSGGDDYNLNDLLVLTGGSSVVPAQIRQAALEIFYYECYKRRLAPDENNPGFEQAKTWRKVLAQIREGEAELDGTFKRYFSAGEAWNQKSVLFGANSL